MITPQSVIFMLDTNILVDWKASFHKTTENVNVFGKSNDVLQRISEFCNNTPHQVVVPDIVWLEMVSLTVQRKIKLGETLEDTIKSFRDKQSHIQQLEQLIVNREWMLGWHPRDNADIFDKAAKVMRDSNLLDNRLFNWMLKRYSENKRPNDTPKLLDGLDSGILIYLDALGKEYSDKKVILYTADYPLSYIASRASRKYHWFAKNTGSVFACFPELECCFERCGCRNPASILNTKEMWCRNPSRRPQHQIVL